MDVVKKALVSTKDFVTDHKTVIVAGVTAVATTAICIAINRSTVKNWNEFLEAEGLLDKFYNPGS